MKFFNQAENSPETVYWDPSGESFIIANTEKFIKILPKYFKTKNYSSFVRQLNMYDFHKIKNSRNYHEFRHEKFKRGRLDDLKNIKRKINDILEIGDNPKGDSKALLIEYNRLKRSASELEDSLRTIASQNKKLIEANKDLVCQMYYFKTENELKTRKLLFLFFILMNNYTPELLGVIRTALAKSNLVSENENNSNVISFKNIGQFIKKLSYKLIFNNEQSDICLDKLMEIFTAYLKEKESSTVKNLQYDWDEFVQKLLNEENLENGINDRFTPLPINHGQHDDFFRKSPLRLDRFSDLDKDSNFDQDSRADKDSVLDLKSENFNDIDFLGNLSRKISSLKSIGENLSFLDGDFNSFNLKSPQSEQNGSLNF